MKPIAIQMILCLFLALFHPLLAVVREQSGSHSFRVKGRVIDRDNKPVPDAGVTFFSIQTEEEKEEGQGCITNYYPTDSEGRFSFEVEDTKYMRWTLYVQGPHAKDMELPISPPFNETLKKLTSTFAGQEVDVTGKTEIDLGDVPVQVYYGQVLVHFTADKNLKLFPNSQLRIRDVRGDSVSEGGIPPNSLRNDNTAIAVSLPEGTWYVGLMSDSAKGWHETSVTVTAPSSQNLLEIYLDINSEATKRSPSASKDSESAKKELTRMGFEFTKEEFVERADNCNIEAVQLFLQAGMSPNAQEDKYGTTALMEAVRRGCQDIFDLLLKEKADVNVKSNNGDTALITAVITYNEDLAKVLIKRGAKVNEQRTDGRTALMFAAFIGKIGIVNLLLRAGANVNLRDREGKTALKWAMEREDSSMIELLKKAGAKE